MSHRKYEQPRRGSTAFSPRKRCVRHQGKVKAFPKDNAAKKPHLTAFMGWKAGMTHVVRDLERVGSKMHKKEVVEGVTIIETPPMVVVGIVGYLDTPQGMRTLTTVWAQHLSEECRRRFYKNWYNSKKKAFTQFAKKWAESKAEIDEEIARIKKYCQVVRVLAHTQPRKVDLRQKKANIMEIQVNGGTTSDKVDYALSLLEKEVKVSDVFGVDGVVDIAGITRGKGFEGTTTRWGTRRLPRKTNKGIRRVGCIGPWHPERVSIWQCRAGQNGYYHRTELHKRIYMTANGSNPACCQTAADLTPKSITPLGGFVQYGVVSEDFIMIKGGVVGPTKRLVTLRLPVVPLRARVFTEKPNLKFIDTSSKFGRGRFQTAADKAKTMGRVAATPAAAVADA